MNSEASNQPVDQQETQKIWTGTFVSLFITNMAFNMGFLMSNSLLSIYARSLGASVSAIGMLISVFSISSILFRLIAAPVMDTYNRRYIVMFSTIMMAAAFFGFSISNDMSALIVFRLIQGCGMAFGNSCCLAMVAETLPKDKYGTGIGYYSVAQVVAQAMGPPIGLWAVDLVGFRMTFAFTSCLMLIATLLAFRIKNKFQRTKKLKLTFNNIIAKEAILPASLMFLQHGGYVIVNSLLVIYSASLGVTANIGLYFTVVACTMLVTRPLVGRLTDRFGLVKVAVPALFCNVASYFILSYSTSLAGFLLSGFIAAFGQGACAPAVQALSMKSVKNERRGAASSTNFIGMDMGNLIGPSAAGRIAESFGYTTMWRTMTAPFILAALVMLVFKKVIARIEDTFASKPAANS